MNKTSIEWTDYSSNALKFRDADGKVVWACVHASPGCLRCYAETLAKRYSKGGPFNVPTMGKLTPFLDEAELQRMLTAKRIGGKDVSGARCFVGDMTDIFGPWVPDEMLDRLFAVFALRSDVTWQVLTKRADRMRQYFNESKDEDGRPARVRIGLESLQFCLDHEPTHIDRGGTKLATAPGHEGAIGPWPLPNVWLGTSVEDQPRADERIPLLLQAPAAVRFISAEPLLGPIDLNALPDPKGDPAWDASALHGVRECAFGATVSRETINKLDWVIVGGESGAGARRCDVAWVRSIVEQCHAANAPVFVKQLGAVVIDRNDAGFMGEESDHWPEAIACRDAVEHDIDGSRDVYQGAPVRVHLLDRKGGDLTEWPKDLRVREFPRPAVSA